MELVFGKNKIVFENKQINNLDKFAIDFTKILSKYSKYVIVSGYVSILFGRSRATEDIDVLVEKKEFKDFFSVLEKKGYWLINAAIEDADEMFKENAVRIAKKGKIIPNIEMKVAKTEIDNIALNERIKVCLGKHALYISPLELQIAYKLFLSSEKDIEDARHLFNIFSEKLQKEKIIEYAKKLNVAKKLKYIGMKDA